jgi:hypothetical protein
MDLAIAGDCDRQMVRERDQTIRGVLALEFFEFLFFADILLVPKNVSSRITVG